jgi:hypothetical protein
MMKTILEINYKLTFKNQADYITYLEQTKNSQPDLCNQILDSEYKKKESKTVIDGELAKRTRTTRVYEIGLS